MAIDSYNEINLVRGLMPRTNGTYTEVKMMPEKQIVP